MERPVFIIGSPRSGTTAFLELLASHEEFAWVSQWVNAFPRALFLSRLNRIYDNTMLGKPLWNVNKLFKALPYAKEPWKFWNTYLANFQWKRGGDVPPRRRTEADLSDEEAGRIRQVVETLCETQGKKRFLSKYTDFPRIRYLSRAFPDAQFIHLLRDGRATAASYYRKIEDGSWRTWEEREWWLRGWPDAWRREWKENYNSSLAFVAYQWKFFVQEIREDAEVLPDDRYLELRYEELADSTRPAISRVVDFCGLKESARLNGRLDMHPISNMNDKWRRNLSAEEQQVLNEIVSRAEMDS